MLFGDPEDQLVLVYDMTLLRPACAILQNAMGGTSGIASEFDSRLWLTSPTPDMKPYIITREQLNQAVAGTNKAHADKLREVNYGPRTRD